MGRRRDAARAVGFHHGAAVGLLIVKCGPGTPPPAGQREPANDSRGLLPGTGFGDQAFGAGLRVVKACGIAVLGLWLPAGDTPSYL